MKAGKKFGNFFRVEFEFFTQSVLVVAFEIS